MEMLGEKLWRLREARGLSQEGLAEKLGVSRQTVSNWENDRATPDAYKLKQLCEALGTSADELLGTGKGGETPREQEKEGERRPKKWLAVFFVVLAAVFAVLAIVLFVMPYESGEVVSSAITLTPKLGGVLLCVLSAILLIPAAMLFLRNK